MVCGTEGPQEAELTLSIDGVDHHIDATGDGPVDAAFNAVKMLFPHKARLQLYQVQRRDRRHRRAGHRLASGWRRTGASSPASRPTPIPIVASVKAYVNALNRLIVRRTKSAPDSDVKSVNYRDAS